jgi:tol-pal system protein YbgF
MKKVLLFLFLACSACVTTAQEGEDMRRDIAELRANIKREADAGDAQRQKMADEQTQRAKALQDALDQLSRAARKSGADLGVDLEKAQNDLTAVHGQLEVIQHRLDALEKGQVDQQKAAEAAAQAAAQQKKEAEHPTDKLALYNLGRQKLEAGQTQRARDLFIDFLGRFPKDELSSNAQYWLGETYYAERKWNDAIGSFQKVIKEYKGSDKVPDALLKIGMSFQAQSDCSNALLFFEDLQQGHKGTAAAKSAKEHIAECKKRR